MARKRKTITYKDVYVVWLHTSLLGFFITLEAAELFAAKFTGSEIKQQDITLEQDML